MEIKKIIETIKGCQIIETAFEFEQRQFRNHYYDICIEAKLIIDKTESLPIIIGIPSDWQLELIDIFLKKYEGKFIPHVERNGKICLFEKEGILIDSVLEGIILQSLFRARDILLAGKNDTNRIEFIDEFELYWAQLPKHRNAKLVVPEEKRCSIIKSVHKQLDQKKKEKQVDFLSRKQNMVMYVAKDTDSLKYWQLKKASAVNSAYFVLDSNELIYPPDIREPLSVDYVNDILSRINNEDITKMLGKLGKEKLLYFRINQPNGSENYFGISLDGGLLQETDGQVHIVSCKKLCPIAVRQVDTNYLIKRTTDKDFSHFDKKLLVIGCGSIGGYVISELCKAGFKYITIVDDDFLTEENIYRHILGMEYVGKYKSVAMKNFLEKNIPGNSIVSLETKIEDAIDDGSIEFRDYDLIISATGNHNINRWINRYVHKNNVCIPIVYAWNEIHGIGNHVGYFKCGNEGCYECLFGRDEDTFELYDRSAYCARSQKIVNNFGCGKSFIPYGNTISLKTSCLVMEIIKEVLDGDGNTNFLISVKEDDGLLKKAGLETSKRYKNQKERIRRLTGKDILKKECGVCSDCIL